MIIDDLWQRYEEINIEIVELANCKINKGQDERYALTVQIADLMKEQSQLKAHIEKLLKGRCYILPNGNVLIYYGGNVFKKELL